MYGMYGYKQENVFGIIGNVICLIIDTSVSVYILYSFTKSIVHLICIQSMSNINDRQQEKLLDLVTRYFILLSSQF